MARKIKNKSKHNIPWFLWLFLGPYVVIFVPIYMLWKLHNEKDNISGNAKKTEIAGWFYFGLGCIYLILGITGQLRYEDGRSAVGGAILLFALMGGIGYAIVRNARKYKYLGLLYKRYFPVISGSATGNLDKIAAVFDEPYEETVENIQKLIDIKLFENSYIDRNHRNLISPIVSSAYKPVPICMVKCPYCDGVNKIIKGQLAECDYCGSVIKGE